MLFRLKSELASRLRPLLRKAIGIEQHSGSASPPDRFDHLASISRAVLSDYAKEEICQRLALGVQYVYGMAVEGDIVEFGTMTGQTAVALSVALHECGQALDGSDRMHGFQRQRNLYLFDSFEGLPAATFGEDKLSPHVSSGVWGRGTCKGLTPQELLDLCARYLDVSRIKIIKGWFKQTVPEFIKGPLALIHVDGDLYESAMDALDPLFRGGYVSPGAAIYFDDWNCNRASPEFGERKAWADLTKKYNIIYSDEGPYGLACHRFIIHSYSG